MILVTYAINWNCFSWIENVNIWVCLICPSSKKLTVLINFSLGCNFCQYVADSSVIDDKYWRQDIESFNVTKVKNFLLEKNSIRCQLCWVQRVWIVIHLFLSSCAKVLWIKLRPKLCISDKNWSFHHELNSIT